MKSVDLEAFVTDFMNLYRSAETAYNDALAAEKSLNDATQDILHCIELCPEGLDPAVVLNKLHEVRMLRRDAKQELEVATQFWEWAQKNKPTMTSLEQNLGRIRKIIRRQPTDSYCFKTDYIKPKGSWIVQEREPEYVQLCLW